MSNKINNKQILTSYNSASEFLVFAFYGFATKSIQINQNLKFVVELPHEM